MAKELKANEKDTIDSLKTKGEEELEKINEELTTKLNEAVHFEFGKMVKEEQFNYSGMRRMEPHAWMRYLDDNIERLLDYDNFDNELSSEMEVELKVYQDIREKMFGKKYPV